MLPKMTTVELNPGGCLGSLDPWTNRDLKAQSSQSTHLYVVLPAAIVGLFGGGAGWMERLADLSSTSPPLSGLGLVTRKLAASRPWYLPGRWQTTAFGCWQLKDEGLEVAARRRNTPHRFVWTSGENFIFRSFSNPATNLQNDP